MTAPAPEKNPAAVETAGLEIAVQRQREGSADPSKREPTTAAGAVEKAAPIPADVLALAEQASWWMLRNFRLSQPSIRDVIARTIMQDRADRASQEERIRERGEFNRGYLIAVANVMNLHKDAVVAAELLVQLGVTIDEAEALDLTDYDMSALKRLRSEPRAAAFFKRKRRARQRGDAS